MIVLRAIGNFFVKIWNWIKNTAWVQPLLIVGAIFAVIFSIPSITSWVQSIAANWNSSDQFYADRKVTLYGGEKSDAYKLFDDVYNEEANKYESKFFLVFVSSSCSACESCMDGFKVLNDNWNSTYIPNNSGEKFAMHTIYVDEAPDDFTETPTYSTAFQQMLGTYGTAQAFFETASAVGQNSYYNLNTTDSSYDTYLGYLESCDYDNFQTPTIVLVDYTEYTSSYASNGIGEVCFGVTGNNSYEQAKFLMEMWNHGGAFSEKGK